MPTPDDTSYLLYDENDGYFIYDANDDYFLRDANQPIIVDPIAGEIDAVGGDIGGPVGERVFLVDTPDATTEPVPAEWLAISNHPIMGRMFGAGLPSGQPFEFRLASRAFTSQHDDPDEPSRYWDGRVLDPGSIALTMPLVPDGERSIETRFGQIVIDNSDAAFDAVIDFHQVVSQPIRIRLGTLQGYLADFKTVCVARVIGVGMSQSALTLDVRDPATYAQNLFPTSVYTGSGGSNGTADLTGAVKPVVLGRVWNMSPVLIDGVKLVYQVHDGVVAAVTGVFDGGAALTFSANYATYALLVAATVAAGQYATCLAEGMIRVGSSPVFAVTAHVDGHSAAGITVRSIAGWLASQLDTELGLEIDAAAFATLPVAVAGWVWTEPFTLAAALSRFVGDAGWHWGADVDGTITTRRLEPPDSAAVVQTFDEPDITDIVREPPPDGFGGVHHRRTVQWKRNWTEQAGSLAATAVDSAYRQRQWRTATASRATGARNAIDPPVLQTSLATQADATALGDHLLDLHGTERRMFTLATKIFGSLPVLGSTVLVRHPRFDLLDGGYFRIVDIELRLRDGAATLLLWG